MHRSTVHRSPITKGVAILVALLASVAWSGTARANQEPGLSSKLQLNSWEMLPNHQVPYHAAQAGKTTITDNDPASAGKLVRIIWTCGGVVEQDVTVPMQLIFPGALMSTAVVNYPASWGSAALPDPNCVLTEIAPVSFGAPTASFAALNYWNSAMHISHIS